MGTGRIRKASGSMATIFTLWIILIFVVAQGGLWGWFVLGQKDLYTMKLQTKLGGMLSLASDIASRTMVHERSAEMKFFLERIAADPDVISIKVIDADANTYHFIQGREELEQSGISWNPFFIPWNNSLEKPIASGEQPMGKVVMQFSGKGVNADMLDLLLLPLIGQGLVFIIVVIMIFAFTHNKMGRPVEILKESMSQVTGGDLTVDIPAMGTREIEDVADGLRYLIRGLSGNVQRLQTVTSGIAEAISTLTSTFSVTIERVKTQSVSTNQIAGSIKLSDSSRGQIKDSTGELKELIDENLASILEVKASEDEILEGMNSLFSSVENSYSVVSEMSKTSQSMMGHASKVLSSVENTSASVEEIIASVREVESSARESSQLAEYVRTLAAQKGVGTVDKAIKGMGRISDKVDTAVSIVGRLETRSLDIQKILAFIKDITEKTNLLSINASILAEQAGEYGKGFTVVAEQMRSLSTRTGAYTKEISGIIAMIQSDVSDVVSAIEDGKDMVTEGGETVYEVGETMSSILEASHTSANMTKMIEKATEDQVMALRHIEKSIIDVNSMAMDMDNAMGEMYKSAGYIHTTMGEVRDIAENAKTGSEELSKGVKLISDNLEGSTRRVGMIDEALSAQRSQDKDILSGVESIRNEGVWIISDLEGLSSSIDDLKGEFDALRKEMDMFRVE